MDRIGRMGGMRRARQLMVYGVWLAEEERRVDFGWEGN